jgi:hypothetical protein
MQTTNKEYDMDVNELSKDLLERLANSIYDRDLASHVYFTKKEIDIVEMWLKEIMSNSHIHT